MRLIRNAKGVSKLILILLLLIDFVLGALLSYIWTMGYYAPLEFHLPRNANVTIESVEFFAQDTSYFNLVVLNPSYGNSSIKITRISARTTEDNRLHVVSPSPTLPYELKRGVSQTFKCSWNWANYTGIKLPYREDKPVEILVFIQDGSGANFEVKRPFVALQILETKFDSAISLTYFNVTVQNLASSATYVNITSISVNVTSITPDMVTPSLPYGLAPGDPSVTFNVFWNWMSYQNQSVTIGVHTQQGYVDYRTLTLPPP